MSSLAPQTIILTVKEEFALSMLERFIVRAVRYPLFLLNASLTVPRKDHLAIIASSSVLTAR